jgi:hypothetical protein
MSDDQESPVPALSAPVTSTHQQSDHHDEHELNAFLKPLALDLDTLHDLAYHFSKTYQHLALHSEEQFLPTPVTKLPTGQETGRYLAIDVGGTNLRVGFIELLGEDDTAENSESDARNERSRDALKKARRPRIRRTLEKAWPIGEHLKMDQAEDLFAWIGDCIAEVVSDSLQNESTKIGDIPDQLDLGITFSFPMMCVSCSTSVSYLHPLYSSKLCTSLIPPVPPASTRRLPPLHLYISSDIMMTKTHLPGKIRLMKQLSCPWAKALPSPPTSILATSSSLDIPVIPVVQMAQTLNRPRNDASSSPYPLSKSLPSPTIPLPLSPAWPTK